MSVKYIKVKKKPTTFNRLFGLSVSQFEDILTKVDSQWQKKVISKYKRPGRDYKLDVADMLLMLLLYYRSYISQEFVGYLFGIDDSRVCRIIQKLESLLAKIMVLPNKKYLSKEEVESLIIDATEHPIERPKKGQKPYYSGKKKRHTVKKERRVTRAGRLIHILKARPGSIHDFQVYKMEPPIPKDTRAFADSGHQGLDKLHTQTELPYKATKTKPLDGEEKEYNQALSRIRVKVEHILGDIKTFRIIGDRYRNKSKRYNIKFNVIAGIVNLKNGFGFA